MNDINTTIISGNLTRDAELIERESFSKIKFSIASNKKYGDNERVIFMDCEMLNRAALAPMLTKGKKIIVEGELQEDSWEHEGKTYKKKYILARKVEFLGSKKDDDNTDEENFEEGHHTA